jgi:pilus assembly protein CpaC
MAHREPTQALPAPQRQAELGISASPSFRWSGRSLLATLCASLCLVSALPTPGWSASDPSAAAFLPPSFVQPSRTNVNRPAHKPPAPSSASQQRASAHPQTKPLNTGKRILEEGLNFQALETEPSAASRREKPAVLPSRPLSSPAPEVSGGGSTMLKGSVTSLKVVKGRSQIIKFAQPLVRVSLADPAVADIIPLAPDQIMVNGKQRGVTSLVVWDEFGQEGIFDLQVENDTSELLAAVQSIAPNEDIQARVTDDAFIVSGRVSNSVFLDEIRRLASGYGYKDDKFVDLTETPAPQVMLEVRIAEMRRNRVYDVATGLAGSSKNFVNSRLDSLPPASGGQPGTITIGQLPVLNTQNVGGLIGAMQTDLGKLTLQARWDLLETRGVVKTLAEPNLVCTHGRTAEFLAGGEFPFVGGINQNGLPLITFKEYGVKLKFTPWIAMRSNRVELNVAPEVSSLDTTSCQLIQNINVCGLTKRTTSTTVELADGESLFISGLLQRSEVKSFQQIPWVAQIPILGNMFKSTNQDKSESELIVVITPHLIQPGQPVPNGLPGGGGAVGGAASLSSSQPSSAKRR